MSLDFANKDARLAHYRAQNLRRTPSGIPETKGGQVGQELKVISFSERTRKVIIFNEDLTTNLSFTFSSNNNDYTNFMTLYPLASFNEPVEVDNFTISGSGAGTEYRIIGIL